MEPPLQISLSRLRNSVHERVFGPRTIGRYTVLEQIGEGGMGRVFAAYDTKLDRKVAVKLLKARSRGAGSLRDRLEREAQALAQLSHPNVVQVYDVGEHDDEVFVAMEFIGGPNLGGWVESEPRRPRDIVRVYADAGRGLAAAHAAGLVHRDFKPQNALVGVDGRVRVVDFGLAGLAAAAGGEEEERRSPAHAAASGSQALLRPLSEDGVLLGTPAYMAPEQHLGLPSDARTDQFSFCLALYEALYGIRPFEGRNLVELRLSVVDGDVLPPPRDRRVPAWMRRVIERGLAREPDQRFPDMSALLSALEADPAVRARRALLGGLVLAAMLGGVSWFQDRETRHAEDAARLAEAKRVEAERAETQAKRAEQAEQTLAERKDELTLDRSEMMLERDPTRAAAELLHLSDGAQAWRGRARLIAADARHRGLAHRVEALPQGSVPQALSDDGRWLMTRAPEQGTLHVTDLASGSRRKIAEGLRTVPVVAIAPGSTAFATLHAPDEVRLWSLPALEPISLGDTLKEHHAIEWSEDGRYFATFGRHPEVHVWSPDGVVPTVLTGHGGGVEQTALRGDTLVTVDFTGTVRTFDLSDPESESATGSAPGLAPIALDHEGRIIAATATGGLARLVLDHSGAMVAEAQWPGEQTPVRAVAPIPDSDALAIGLVDGNVLQWEPQRGARAHRITAHEDEVVELRFATGTQHLISRSRDETVALTDLEGTDHRLLRGHGGVAFWSITAGGDELVTAGWDSIRRWPLDDARRPPFELPSSRATAVATVGEALLVGANDGAVHRIVGNAPPQLLAHVGAPIVQIVSDPKGHIVAVGDSGAITLLSVDGSTRTLHRGRQPPSVLALAPGTAQLYAAAGPDGLLRWDLESNAKPSRVGTQDVRVEGIAVHDGTIAFAGWTPDGRTWVGSIGPDQQVHAQSVDDEGILAVAFDPARGRVAWSKHTRQIAMLEDGKIASLGKHDALVEAMMFLDEGRTLVTAARDGSVKLWDPDSGKHRTVAAARTSLRGLAYQPGSGTIVAAAADGRIHFVRDDLPYDPSALREWLRGATTLRVP